MQSKQLLKKLIIVVFWLCVWQLATLIINNKIIFAGPFEVLQILREIVFAKGFIGIIIFSFARILLGFVLGLIIGLTLAALAHKWSIIKDLLKPLFSTVQAIPVASFVILALIWLGAKWLSVLITFLVVLPIIYNNVILGLEAMDKKMLEVAKVFRLSMLQRAWRFYRPMLVDYIQTAGNISFSMAWKAGAAAELIAVPDHSIGEKLYFSKIYLNTGELFAWTFIIIILSFGSCKLFELLVKLVAKLDFDSFRKYNDAPTSSGADICFENASKAFGEKVILDNVNEAYSAGQTYIITGESGIGKTTKARIILGLEPLDVGHVKVNDSTRFSMTFQENRLFDHYTALENVCLTLPKREAFANPTTVLAELIGQENIDQKVENLSGGMQRRVAIARALAAPSEILILDEPYANLDKQTAEKTKQIIEQYRHGRTLIIITH